MRVTGPADRLRTTLQASDLNLYLDTNVLLDVLRPERHAEGKRSAELLDDAQSRGWQCTTSFFALMEMLDREQENLWIRSGLRQGQDLDFLMSRKRQRQLTPQRRGSVKALFAKFVGEVEPYLKRVAVTDQVSEQALQLAMDTDISAPDCIHVATALTEGCQILVTRDDDLKRLAEPYLVAAKPSQILQELGQLSQ